MKKHKLLTVMITPDGTRLISHHRHDVASHVDKNGESYYIDGGNDYIRSSVNNEKPKIVDIFNSDSHDKIREYFVWGTYGKTGNSPLKYVILKDLEESHINAILETQTLNQHTEKVLHNELAYRLNLGI